MGNAFGPAVYAHTWQAGLPMSQLADHCSRAELWRVSEQPRDMALGIVDAGESASTLTETAPGSGNSGGVVRPMTTALLDVARFAETPSAAY